MLLLTVLGPMSEVTMFFLQSAYRFVEAPSGRVCPKLAALKPGKEIFNQIMSLASNNFKETNDAVLKPASGTFSAAVALGFGASMSSVCVALSEALVKSDPEAVDRRDDVRGNDVFPAVCLSICRRPFWSSMRVVRVCLFE